MGPNQVDTASLAELGRYKEALEAINQAVAIRRDLAKAWPTVFGPKLGSSLTIMAVLLQTMGRTSEAKQALAEADRL